MAKPINTATSDSLSEAINKLEAYALRAGLASGTSVSRTISIMRSLFMSSFGLSPKQRKHEKKSPKGQSPNKCAVLDAVETINKHRFFIEKLCVGSAAEKELAESFVKKIDVYNKSCDRQLQDSIIKGKGLARFLFRKKSELEVILPKVSLLKKNKSEKFYSQSFGDDSLLTPNFEAKEELIPVPKQSAELFQMKVLSLLERYGIASNPEARAYVKESPIKASAEPNSSKYTLMQTLSLFPGQTIVVKASSMLGPKSQTICRLFPENFCLSLESTATGFPHPSQRSGWALSHQLLPENPQRIDMLGISSKMLKRRAEAISGLLSQGALLNEAKKRLSEKKRLFQAIPDRFIDLHEQLFLEVAKAASTFEDLEETNSRFYKALRSHPHPFEWLSETHHEIRETFIARPHEALIKAILQGKSTDLSHRDPEFRYKEAYRILDEKENSLCEELEKKIQEGYTKEQQIRSKYILNFGRLIGSASRRVMLQYFSEDLVFPPPKLTCFQNMLQAAAFTHLNGFLDELENPSILYSSQLEESIREDIAIFNSDGEFPICREMKEYYAARYSSLKEF